MGELSVSRGVRHRSRLGRVLAAGVAMAALMASAACTDNDADRAGADPGQSVTGSAPGGAAAAVRGTVTISPRDGVTDAPTLDPLRVTATDAKLDDVTVVDGKGGAVKGTFTADKGGWTSTGTLKYRSTYTVTVTATNDAGQPITQKSRFSTVKPAELTMPYLRANGSMPLASRKTYGVGQPIVVWFDERVRNREAAEKTLQVTTTPKVTGAWHWYTDQEVHWRPRKDWAPGTKVTVKANVYGVDLGRGLYGEKNRSASFTIGPKHVAIADDNTDHIKVYLNGKLDRTVPTSMGRHETRRGEDGTIVNLRTRSGVHVVLGNALKVKMTGASYGLTGKEDYEFDSRYNTRISYQGEYLHENLENLAKMGKENASHGCLNLGTRDARWFMNNFIPGDVVEVKNTGLQLDSMDGLTDWNMSWKQWLAGSELGEH